VNVIPADDLDIKVDYVVLLNCFQRNPKLRLTLQFHFPVTLMYSLQWLNLIDLMAILPFYVERFGGGGTGASVLRVLRLIRVFRVLKMPKLRACAEMFIDVVTDALPALSMLFFMMSMICIFMASLILFTEGTNYSVDEDVLSTHNEYGAYVRPTADGYGEEVTPFRSFTYAFWWFFTTATTVGYGDFYPTTVGGQLVAIMTFYSGIILLALPISVVGRCFNKYYPDWVKSFPDKTAEEEKSPKTSSSVEKFPFGTSRTKLSYVAEGVELRDSHAGPPVAEEPDNALDNAAVYKGVESEQKAECHDAPEAAVPDQDASRAAWQ
jgi:hypothetical protein